MAQLASYDDLGKIQKSAYVLEKGKYQFYLITSVRETEQVFWFYNARGYRNRAAYRKTGSDFTCGAHALRWKF